MYFVIRYSCVYTQRLIGPICPDEDTWHGETFTVIHIKTSLDGYKIQNILHFNHLGKGKTNQMYCVNAP